MLTGQENRERYVTPVSNLTYWVTAESAVFTVVAEKKAALHCDILFDVLSWRWRRSTVLLLKTAMFECNILTHRVPVCKTETVWKGMARCFRHLILHTELQWQDFSVISHYILNCTSAVEPVVKQMERLHSDLFFTSPFFGAYPGGRGV
jgi:hypothetical protein